MKTLYSNFIPAIFLMLFLIAGCSQEEQPQPQPESMMGEGIEVEEAWARPGSADRMSAAYFILTNFDEEPDTLLSVETDAAELVEIHESYITEEGLTGMRDVSQVLVPSQSSVPFREGGLHVMLIMLSQTLEEGDSIDMTLNFARTGSQTITVPVRL